MMTMAIIIIKIIIIIMMMTMMMIIIELYVDHRSEGVSIRGHGFDSRSSLNFFRFLLFNRLG